MACKTDTIIIDDKEFTVRQWPAQKSLLNKFKLIKAFGASLALLTVANDESDTMETISDAISKLFENTSPEELVALMKDCIIGVGYNNKRITETSFDEIFSGEDLISTYKVFLFVLKTNYADLMKGQKAKSLLAKMDSL